MHITTQTYSIFSYVCKWIEARKPLRSWHSWKRRQINLWKKKNRQMKKKPNLIQHFLLLFFFFLYFISINYLFWICLRWIYLWSFRIDQWHLLLLLICAFVRIFRFICIYLFIVHHMRRSVILVAITHERTAKTRLINGMAFHPIRLFAFLLSLNIDERLSQQKPE